MPDLRQEGTLTAWLEHDHRDWFTNDDTYNFGPFDGGIGVTFSAVKRAPYRLDLQVDGALERSFSIATKAKPAKSPSGRWGVHIGLTWGRGMVRLYVNGKLAKSIAREDGKDITGGQLH